MIKQFDKVNLIYKKIKYDLTMPFKNRKLRASLGLTNTVFPSNLYAIRIYSINNEIYVYCSNKYMYKLDNGTFIKTEMKETSNEPLLITALIDGVKTVVKTPFGKDAIPLNGRLIIADDKRVYISKKEYNDWRNLTENDCIIIGFSENEGVIQGMLSSGENLLVLTEKSLFKISQIDGDVSVKMLNTPVFSIEKNTFARLGNKACFLGGDKIYVIKNEKLTVEKSVLDNTSVVIADKAGTAKNSYLLPLYIGGSKVIFIYNFESGESQLMADNSQALSYENGYVIGAGKLKKFQYEYYDAGVLGTAPDPEDMGTCKPKTIIEIEACIKGNATLRINGDFGYKDVKLNEGCNMFRVNLTSKRFTFAKLFSSLDFTLEEITLKYIVHEDSKNAI